MINFLSYQLKYLLQFIQLILLQILLRSFHLFHTKLTPLINLIPFNLLITIPSNCQLFTEQPPPAKSIASFNTRKLFLFCENGSRFLQIYVHLRIILKAEIKRKIFA